VVVVPAYAKLNLCLEVLGRRADGFHEISSVMVTVDWHDLVGLEAAPGGSRLTVHTAADGIGHGMDNLVLRAAEQVGAGDVALHLWKSIPAGAGLGGGSSDAAAVLRLLAAPSQAVDAAAALGSDVPFTLAGGCALARGRGELLTRLPVPVTWMAVAVLASCSTAAVYAALEPEDLGDGARTARVAEAVAAGDRPAAADLGSALEAAACRVQPALRGRLAALRDADPAAGWALTGSGGAAFALVERRTEAARLATAAARMGLPARVCRTVAAP
jgi:4-diphosphocytidyl-2-C-methyl-D-erythritol kinase